MNQRYIDPTHLTAENVTFADCAESFLVVHADCGRCRMIRGMLPEKVKGPASRVPMIELFADRKLKCQKCGTASDRLRVTFEGNSVVPSRTILEIAAS